MTEAWIRLPVSRLLLWVTLMMTMVLGTAFVAVNDSADEVLTVHGAALTDEQSAAQVVDAARWIVAAAQLDETSAGYTFMSCNNGKEPPYQAALYMNFVLPQDDWLEYFDEVTSAMIAGGWTDSPLRGERFGRTLTKDGVTSVITRNVDATGVATIRLYGQCRNTSDHRDDNPAWTAVTL